MGHDDRMRAGRGRASARVVGAHLWFVASVAGVLAAACVPPPPPPDPPLPPAGAGLDYQLGGAYPPPAGVGVLSRDRTDPPAAGLYNLCYVNGFQTQPGEADWWLEHHPELVLRDGAGNPVIDPDWPDEMLLDVTTAAKRSALAGIVGGWIDGCADDGYDAVEIDNLDTYSRSGGRISADHAVAFIRLLADRAHAAGVAIGQKNSVELLGRRDETDLDFVVAEECNRYHECGEYTATYGGQVYVIEYRRADFDRGCAAFPELSIVLRDRQLRTPAQSGYVRDAC
jgi:hypothetical protein